MTKILAGLTLGVALLATPLAAASNTAQQDPNEVVCKREKKVNSRFTTKTCYTRAEWAARAEQAKRDHAEQRSNHNIGGGRDR